MDRPRKDISGRGNTGNAFIELNDPKKSNFFAPSILKLLQLIRFWPQTVFFAKFPPSGAAPPFLRSAFV